MKSITKRQEVRASCNFQNILNRKKLDNAGKNKTSIQLKEELCIMFL